MTEKMEPVACKSDTASDSISKNTLDNAANGKFDAKGFRASVGAMLVFVIMVTGAMFFSAKTTNQKTKGRLLQTPTVTSTDSPAISPKLLTERDLVNVIQRPKVEKSTFGKIQIVSLHTVSEIPIGSEVRAVLVSGATDGIVKAKLTAPLLVDGEPILPERAVLFGKGKSGDERLFLEFQKVILPDGQAYPIHALGFDVSDKILGLKGDVVGTRTKKMAAAMGFGFLGGMASGLQSTSGSSMFGYTQTPSARDAALAGASKAALDQSQAYIEEMKQSPNIIEVKSGTELVVIFDEPKKKEETYERK
jgi:hypothetical protein